jgi:membrane protein
MRLKEAPNVLLAAVNAWLEDRAPSMGAAIAYYTVFSLAPILILVIAIAGVAFGEEAAEGAIVAQLRELLGRQGAVAVQTMIASAGRGGAGWVASIISLALLAFAATTVFGELQASLNVIWKAAPRPGSPVVAVIRVRLISLSLVIGIGFLLLVSLVVSATLTAFADYLYSVFPYLNVVMRILNFVLSFSVTTALFAMIYKLLPDTRIEWADVWIAALVASILFTFGKFAISLYIGSSNVASTYGAAAALVIVLIWVYYSAQIFLFGAEFAKVYALRYGSHRDRRRRRQERRAARRSKSIGAPGNSEPAAELAQNQPARRKR